MDQLLQAECTVAVLGIEHALRAKPRPPSDADLKRADKLPDVIKRRTRELVAMTKQSAQAGPPELPDFMETHELLSANIDPDKLVDTLVGIPEDRRLACALVWGRGVVYLNERLPRRVEMQLTGPRLHEPSTGEFAEWGWAWRIANDPLFVLDLAADGMLIGIEVEHFKTLYPAIYEQVCGGIWDALTDRHAAEKEWVAPWWLQKQLCTVLGVSPVSNTLVADIDAALKQSQAETKTRASALKITRTGETQSQKLAEGAA